MGNSLVPAFIAFLAEVVIGSASCLLDFRRGAVMTGLTVMSVLLVAGCDSRSATKDAAIPAESEQKDSTANNQPLENQSEKIDPLRQLYLTRALDRAKKLATSIRAENDEMKSSWKKKEEAQQRRVALSFEIVKLEDKHQYAGEERARFERQTSLIRRHYDHFKALRDRVKRSQREALELQQGFPDLSDAFEFTQLSKAIKLSHETINYVDSLTSEPAVAAIRNKPIPMVEIDFPANYRLIKVDRTALIQVDIRNNSKTKVFRVELRQEGNAVQILSQRAGSPPGTVIPIGSTKVSIAQGEQRQVRFSVFRVNGSEYTLRVTVKPVE